MALIIDTDGDRESWDPVLAEFTATFLEPTSLKTVMPYPVVADAFDRAKQLDRPIDLVVGVGDGAGPAAALVAEGQARRGVLLEPGLVGVVAEHPEFAHISLDLQPIPDVDALESMAAEIESDTWGPELIKRITCGDHPDASVRARSQVAQRVLPTRMPLDRTIPEGGPGKDLANWVPAWRDDRLDLQVWLPEAHRALAEALAAVPDAGALVVQPWPAAGWLVEPQKVAHALTVEIPAGR